MFKRSIVPFNTKQKSCKVHLEESLRAFEKGNKDLIKRTPLLQISKPDPSNVQETNAQSDSDPSSSCCSCWPHRTTRKVVTQLYCPKPSDLVASVCKELTSVLNKHMSKHNIELKIKIRMSTTDLNKDVPLILICLVSSRLGTDVSNAIKGIQTGPNVAVLILHHADIHALPTQSSREILTAPEYKTINTIVDMGFVSGTGFHDCDMNQKSLADLAFFIKQMEGKQ